MENDMIPRPQDGQSRKEYTEAYVPELIRQGKTPNQAIAEATSTWCALKSEEAKASEDMET
jgi:hypothetical protein